MYLSFNTTLPSILALTTNLFKQIQECCFHGSDSDRVKFHLKPICTIYTDVLCKKNDKAENGTAKRMQSMC